MAIALDIDGETINIGDIVVVKNNPKPYHKWLHEGNILRVVRIDDRNFQGEEACILFFETINSGRQLHQGLDAHRVKLFPKEEW